MLRFLLPAVLSLSLVSGLYIKGRMDGFNSCQRKSTSAENELYIEALKKLEDQTKVIKRLEVQRSVLKELSKELADLEKDVKNEIPNDDSSCNLSPSISRGLHDSLNSANNKVFGESSN
jgi:hypothetical protein